MSDVKLQVALDFLELSRALEVCQSAVAGGAEYIEAGTPLIKSEGLDCVRKLREMFPDKTIIADMKTMDAGKIEAEAAAKAGANVMTVCGTAAMSTIRECVETGRQYGIEVAVDLLEVKDPIAFAKAAGELGVSWLDVHCPIDEQMTGGDPLALLKELRPITDLTLAVAGGINSETAAQAAAAGADVVIVGGAITKAIDPEQSTSDIISALESKQAVASDLFKRGTADNIIEVLKKVRTSNISDGAHRQPCLADIRPLIAGKFICGPAVTVSTMPGDWAKPVEAIDHAKEGDILVIDACGQGPAIWGELATESAKSKKLAGLVVNGAVRDTADIRKLDFPVWTKLVTTHAGDPNGIGDINQPVVISDQRICPGDWIVADDDGVMVLPKNRVVEMANRACDVLEAENRIRQEIRDGKGTLAQVVNLLRWEKKSGKQVIG